MKHFYVFLFFFVSMGGWHTGYAQKPDQPLIDSLLQQLQKAKEDTNKVKLLDDLSYNYRFIKQEDAIKYGQQELDLATKLTWKQGIAKATNNLATSYDSKSDYPKALEYYQKALKITEETTSMADINVNIANVYEKQNDFQKALECYFKAVKIYQTLGDKNKIALVNGSIGNIYNEQADYDDALEYYQKALSIDIEMNNKFDFAINEGNIGNVYFNQNDYPKSLEYHFKSLKIYQELWQKNSVAYEYQIIGNIYIEMEYYPLAIYYEKMGLKIAEETDNKLLAGYILATIGNAYVLIAKDGVNINKGNVPKVKSLEKYKRETWIPTGKAARLHLAVNYLQRGLAVGLKMQINQLTQYCYESLADAYKLNGNFKKAIEYTNSYHAVIDSVFSKRNKEKLQTLEMKNQFEKQHITDSMQTVFQQKKAIMKLKRQQSYLLIAICFSLFVLIIIALIYFNYVRVSGLHKKVILQKNDLENSNREKERILQIVAHDLRSPVGSIAYISDLMMMEGRSEKEMHDSLAMIKNASVASLELINELVGQNEDNRSPNKKLMDIGCIIKECIDMVDFKAIEKQQSIVTHIPTAPIYVMVNHERIIRVINNLVVNAIKFSNAKQVIEVTLEEDEANAIIKIKDNGIGIPENMKKEVFDIFTDSKRYGTLGEKPFGLGLYISRQIIEAHGGTITFESKENEETTFYIRLPKKAAKNQDSVNATHVAHLQHSQN